MTDERAEKDLALLVPDRNTEAAMVGILARTEALAIRPVRFDRFVHPERDPGCRLRSGSFLRLMSAQYAHALVLFDKEGSGAGDATREDLEAAVEGHLRASGWGDRAAAVVIDPELEAWVWSESPHVESVLGWVNRPVRLRTWLESLGFLETGRVKPARPKEAMERVLREVNKPRSSFLYQELARLVTLKGCQDPAFAKLRSALQGWFGT